MISSCIIIIPVDVLASKDSNGAVAQSAGESLGGTWARYFVRYFHTDGTSHFENPMMIHGMGLAAQQVLVPL